MYLVLTKIFILIYTAYLKIAYLKVLLTKKLASTKKLANLDVFFSVDIWCLAELHSK